jgi:predicted DNA-binding transcriptional regulator AlpA
MSRPEVTGNNTATLPPGLDALRILSARQASELLGISLATLRRLYWAGKLPAAIRISERRLGWRVADLLAYAQSRIAA